MVEQKSKIEKMGTKAELLTHQWRAEGYGYRKIADKLEEQYPDMTVSHKAVQTYVKNRMNKRLAKLGAKNAQELEKREIQKILDTGDELKEVYDKLKGAIDNLDEKDRQDVGYIIQLAKEMRQMWEFHKKFVEEVLQPKIEAEEINQTNIEVNKTEAAFEFNNYLRELESDGVIEIKDPARL